MFVITVQTICLRLNIGSVDSPQINSTRISNKKHRIVLSKIQRTTPLLKLCHQAAIYQVTWRALIGSNELCYHDRIY